MKWKHFFAIIVLALTTSPSWAIENESYTTADGAVTIILPEGINEKDIRSQKDGQGITNMCVFTPKDGPISGIVSTKIRKEFPRSDEILHRTAARYRQEIYAEDHSTLEHIEKITIGERLFLMSLVRHMERGNATKLKATGSKEIFWSGQMR